MAGPARFAEGDEGKIFNIVGDDHETMKALLESGFDIPKALRQAPPTNSDKTMFYDQIAFAPAPAPSTSSRTTTPRTISTSSRNDKTRREAGRVW